MVAGIDVIPIAKTEVNWDTYLRATLDVLGRSITNTLDEKGMNAVGLAAFLATIAELKKAKTDPVKLFRNGSNTILKHVQQSFLVYDESGDTLEELNQYNLIITGTKKLVIISADVKTWREAVLNALKIESTTNMRIVFGKIWVYFDRHGLGELWGYYKLKTHTDKTFILESKYDSPRT